MCNIKRRWLRAQEYELNWWQNRIGSINLSYLRAFAEDILKEYGDIIKINPETVILEIGSGPAGVLTYLKSDERYAVDPLEEFFSSIESFRSIRDPQVKYISGQAESLPFIEKKIDFIIADNVLDHCENVRQSVSEISRVIKDGGIVYVKLNTYSRWGKFIRVIAEKIELDKGHPNTLSISEIENLFLKMGMQTLKRKNRSYFKSLQRHFKSSWIKGLLKMITFSVPKQVEWAFQKNNQTQ